MEFELESEPDATCPLCAAHPEFEDHDVQVKPNKGGKPFVYCDRLRTSINIREHGSEFLAPFVENATGDGTALAQPAGSSEGDSGSKTLGDVLKGGDGE